MGGINDMATTDHQWITLHRIRFPSPISALQRNFEIPSKPECWRFCPSQHIGEDGLPTWISDTWCGLGIFNSRSDADAMIATPEEQLPFLSEAVEQWHSLAMPITHRGEVNWRGEIEENSAVRVAPEDPTGRLAVLTTAGFLQRNPERIARFVQGVEDVTTFFGQTDGNVRRDVFNGGFDQREGFTVSLWRNDQAMTKAAYWEGVHRTLMDKSRDGSTFDRSSFTRLRIISGRGSWDGDPLAEMN